MIPKWEHIIQYVEHLRMKLLGKTVLDEFKRNYPAAASRINALQAELENADWSSPNQLKNMYGSASILPNNQVVFNIKGNKFRILALVDYRNRIILIKKAGTHKQYDKW